MKKFNKWITNASGDFQFSEISNNFLAFVFFLLPTVSNHLQRKQKSHHKPVNFIVGTLTNLLEIEIRSSRFIASFTWIFVVADELLIEASRFYLKFERVTKWRFHRLTFLGLFINDVIQFLIVQLRTRLFNIWTAKNHNLSQFPSVRHHFYHPRNFKFNYDWL